jgi:hypothetical protein
VKPGHDHIDFEPSQLRRQLGKAANLSLVGPELVPHGLAFDVTQIAHPVLKQPPEFIRAWSPNHQNADGRGFRLLRGAGERPERRRAAEKGEEVAPPH